MLTLSFDYPPGWYNLVILTLVLWIAIAFYRKSFKNRKEVRSQIAVTSIFLGILVVYEFLGVNFGLYNYTGGNWPAILWLLYFIGGLMGYQIVKLIEEKF